MECRFEQLSVPLLSSSRMQELEEESVGFVYCLIWFLLDKVPENSV